MIGKHILISNRTYRHVFLVQNRDYWNVCPFPYDKELDLVLSFDFGVVNEIKNHGGSAYYLDHLVDSKVMERFNYEVYVFFAKWHTDKEDNDIFSYKGIKIGNAFRIEIWNEITYYTRILINLLAIRGIQYKKMFVGVDNNYILQILDKLGIEKEIWIFEGTREYPEYYFPIFRWMLEKTHPSGTRQMLKMILSRTLDVLISMGEKLKIIKKGETGIFIHPYYPTKDVIENLKKDERVNVILENYTWSKGITRETRLPLWKTVSSNHKRLSEDMINNFQVRKGTRWEIEGINIGEILYEIILDKVVELLPYYLKVVDVIISYFSDQQLKLMVTIANIGIVNCLMLNYCHKNNIPTYLIINGLLGSSYLDEAKDATWINSYGQSIKDNYFAGMENIVCLGDPRMDKYVNNTEQLHRTNENPTIVIGTAGFSNIDLNSYVAYEFDFMNDVMTACKILLSRGRSMNILIRVRSNGYIEQYSTFLKEYYPDVAVELDDRNPIIEILQRTDFYISIYSQTLFEASVLGIPVLYYKKDSQIMHAPFDGESELVTAFSVNDLVSKMEFFYEQHPMYEAFKEKKVMEKYVGPLDGMNIKRNMDFIYSLLDKNV